MAQYVSFVVIARIPSALKKSFTYGQQISHLLSPPQFNCLFVSTIVPPATGPIGLARASNPFLKVVLSHCELVG